MTQPVLILGAGLAGLSLARKLSAHSIPVRIFEASPQLRKPSYGITLLSWAYEPLANSLKLGSVADLRAATATDSLVGGLGVINTPFKDALTGATLVSHSSSEQNEQSYRCSRFRLSTLLMQGLHVEVGHKLEKVQTNSTGVMVHFVGGQTAEGSLAVGADGVHSAVRRSILPNVAPAVMPAMAINGRVSLAKSDFDAGIGKHMQDSQVIAGVADRTALSMSVSNQTDSEVLISWTFTWQPEAADDYVTDRHSIDGAHTIPQTFFDRLAKLGHLAEPFQSVLSPNNARQTAMYNWLMRSIQIPKHELIKSADNGIALIGDAAHAMPIVAGEGGNHALLDGMQLGEALALAQPGTDSLVHQVQTFYQAQHARWETGVLSSQERFFELHKPIEQWRSLQ